MKSNDKEKENRIRYEYKIGSMCSLYFIALLFAVGKLNDQHLLCVMKYVFFSLHFLVQHLVSQMHFVLNTTLFEEFNECHWFICHSHSVSFILVSFSKITDFFLQTLGWPSIFCRKCVFWMIQECLHSQKIFVIRRPERIVKVQLN